MAPHELHSSPLVSNKRKRDAARSGGRKKSRATQSERKAVLAGAAPVNDRMRRYASTHSPQGTECDKYFDFWSSGSRFGHPSSLDKALPDPLTTREKHKAALAAFRDLQTTASGLQQTTDSQTSEIDLQTAETDWHPTECDIFFGYWESRRYGQPSIPESAVRSTLSSSEKLATALQVLDETSGARKQQESGPSS